MPMRSFPVRLVLKHVTAALIVSVAWLGCGHEQSDLTAPEGRTPSFSRLGEPGQPFVSIDYPGATSTTAQSISASGEILGRYRGADGIEHGFLLVRGTFSAVPDVPGPVESVPNRVNAPGTIVGTVHGDNEEHGYILDGGTFTTIPFPSSGQVDVTGWGINSRGDVVGIEDPVRDFVHAHGYLFSKNAFTVFDFPDAMGTFPTAISDNGSIVGSYITSDFVIHGFLLSRETFTTIHFPNSTFDWVNDVNSRGEIAGFYNDQDGTEHGFVQNDGVFKALELPGATSNAALGINAQGDVVGRYATPDGTVHGYFLACAACSLRPR